METSKLVHLPSAFKTRMQEVDASNALQNNKNNRYLGRDLTDVFNTKSPNQIMKNLLRRRNSNLFDDIGVGDHFSLKPGIDYQEQTSPETKISISKFSSYRLPDMNSLPKYTYSFNKDVFSYVFSVLVNTSDGIKEFIFGVIASSGGFVYYMQQAGDEGMQKIEFNPSLYENFQNIAPIEILRSENLDTCYIHFYSGFLTFNTSTKGGVWTPLLKDYVNGLYKYAIIAECSGVTYKVLDEYSTSSSQPGSGYVQYSYHNKFTITNLDSGETVYTKIYSDSYTRSTSSSSSSSTYDVNGMATPMGLIKANDNFFIFCSVNSFGRSYSSGSGGYGSYYDWTRDDLKYFTCLPGSSPTLSSSSIVGGSVPYKISCRDQFAWVVYSGNVRVFKPTEQGTTLESEIISNEHYGSMSRIHICASEKVCVQAASKATIYQLTSEGILKEIEFNDLDAYYSTTQNGWFLGSAQGTLDFSQPPERSTIFTIAFFEPPFKVFNDLLCIDTQYNLFKNNDFVFNKIATQMHAVTSSSSFRCVAVGNSILHGSTVLDFTPSHTLQAVSGKESFIAVGDQGEGVLILPDRSTQEFTIDSQINFKAVACSNSNKWIAAGLDESHPQLDPETAQAGYKLKLYECTNESSMTWTKTSEFNLVRSVSLFPYQDTVVVFMKTTKGFKAYVQESDEWNPISLPQGCNQLISSSNYSSLVTLTDSGFVLISEDAGEHWYKLIQSPLNDPKLSWTPDATYIWDSVEETIIAYKITTDKIRVPSISLFVETGIKISPNSSFPETIILALLNKLGLHSYDISPNSARSLNIDDLTYAIKLPPLFKLNPDLYEHIQHNWFLGDGNVLAPRVEILTEQTTGEAEIVLTFSL